MHQYFIRKYTDIIRQREERINTGVFSFSFLSYEFSVTSLGIKTLSLGTTAMHSLSLSSRGSNATHAARSDHFPTGAAIDLFQLCTIHTSETSSVSSPPRAQTLLATTQSPNYGVTQIIIQSETKTIISPKCYSAPLTQISAA